MDLQGIRLKISMLYNLRSFMNVFVLIGFLWMLIDTLGFLSAVLFGTIYALIVSLIQTVEQEVYELEEDE